MTPNASRIAVARLALVLALSAACHREPPEPPVVARLGEKDRIFASDLQAEIDRVRTEAETENKLEGDTFAALRKAVLDDLIDRRLLLNEALAQGVAATDREIDDLIAKRAASQPPENVGEKRKQPSPEELRARTREQVLIDRLLLKEVVARVALGPDDARNYYKEHADEFRRPEEIRVQQILVPRRSQGDTDAREQAQALRKELNRGVDFATLAKRQSAAPEARRGGDLGWFGKGVMPAEFDEVCFKLRRGQVSDVTETPYGFHIFKLTDRRDAVSLPFEQVEANIELRLKRDAVQKAQSTYIEKLRQRTTVTFVEAELAKVI